MSDFASWRVVLHNSALLGAGKLKLSLTIRHDSGSISVPGVLNSAGGL